MEWPSAGGPVTLTVEHIADAAMAWKDPLIVPARLKIGHSDPRFADPEDPGHDPFYDGEPAFGSIHNLRVINDGATLVGDYVNVPAWLAEVLPSAYPNRSIEGAYAISEGPGGKLEARWDVETNGGKRYSFVLTACALLGIQRPAVQDLEDLRFLLTEGGGVVVTGDGDAEGAEGGAKLAVSLSGMSGVSLEASVDKVIDAFYAEYLTADPEDPEYWFWVRDMRVDPNALLIDDNKGSLYLLPVSSDDDQNVAFGDYERVLQTFRPAPEATAAVCAAAAGAVGGGHIVKAFAAREQSVPKERKEAPEGGVSAPGNNSGMKLSEDQIASLRKRLDLAEDATDEQIAAALEAEPETPPATEPPVPADPEIPETPEEAPEEEPNQEPSEETPAEEPTVPVDKTVLAELQANSELGRQAREKQVSDHRESVLKAALSDGKITPASKGAWEKKLKAAPEATEAELASLPKNLVPVEEIGHGGSTTGSAVEVSSEELGTLFPGHGKVAA